MAALDESVFWLTITELNAKLRAREFSCVELTRAFCDRLLRLSDRAARTDRTSAARKRLRHVRPIPPRGESRVR